MSENQDDGPGQREVAYRLFATEFDDADFSYSESDEERAPNYVITPTGARVNRLFAVGVLTEVEQVGDEVLRARVVDPTGAFVLYAGQYQPDEMAFLERADVPSFVAVTGKARTFQPDDSETVYTSIRPESISTVDAATRDRWTVQTVEQTVQRIGHAATALSLGGETPPVTLREEGVPEEPAHGIALALDHYGTTPTYLATLRETALDAARLVKGDIDEVDSQSLAPDAPGDTDLSALINATAATGPSTDTGGTTSDDSERTVAGTTPDEAMESTADAGTEPNGEVGSEPTTDDGTADVEREEFSQSQPATATTMAEDGTEQVTDDAGTGSSELQADDDDDLGDFDPGEFELDDDEREEIEDEYGTEFQSGTDVPEPGQADIDTPDPEQMADTDTDSDGPSETATPPSEPEPATDDESSGPIETESAPTSDAELTTDPNPDEAGEDDAATAEQGDVDIDHAVIDVMEELDDGDGADRSALIERVTDRYGVTEGEVDDAIQDALMSGRCYEPDETTLKSI
jgi:RPA family protein